MNLGIFIHLFALFICSHLCFCQNKGRVLKHITKITDLKEFKKLIRTKNNVLAVYLPGEDSAPARRLLPTLGETAEKLFGKATIALLDCNHEDGRKVCKKHKINSPSNAVLKHYSNGEFNKDYDRQLKTESMVRFLNDPTGEIPWEEEPLAKDVLHIQETGEWIKLLKKEKKPILVMFYAPWCGHCKRLKPDYGMAATELKNDAVLAAADLTRSELAEVSKMFEVKGYPTILYFEHGQLKYNFGGERTKEGILAWMKDPQPEKEAEKEKEWEEEESDVIHLTDSDFDATLAQNSAVLVMFYAPWCGHCKTMKPEMVKAAAHMKAAGIPGILAAVDATKHKAVSERFSVSGFPTVKFFKDGEVAFDVNERTSDKIIEFMKDPKEPPPPPPPEVAWSESGTPVFHLTQDNFQKELKKKKHALVMFYAPWCGHCKAAKPEFDQVSKHFEEDPKIAVAAVDCTLYHDLCDQHDVKGFPSIMYFSYLSKEVEQYNGGRTAKDFIQFLNSRSGTEQVAKTTTQTPPASNFGAVLVLTESNFESVTTWKDRLVIMFFAPWCGHCKRAKPDFIQAAEELKNEQNVGLAAVDCTLEMDLCKEKGVQGYPTIQIFEKGIKVKDFTGDRSLQSFKNAALGKEAEKVKPIVKEEAVEDWGSVALLNEDNFQTTLDGSVKSLVMFFAPWCGHCKKAKPAFIEAASKIPKGTHTLGAVDCTVQKELCAQNEVKGYPTFYFYENGKRGDKYGGGRTMEDFVKAVAAPEEVKKEEEKVKPAAKEEAVEDWSSVALLNADNFQSTLDGSVKSLVMFFAPWCGHCKRAKPAFIQAASIIPKGTHILGAVDCTVQKELCAQNEVRGYPTFYFFENGKRGGKYGGGRTLEDFVKAVAATEEVKEKEEKAKPVVKEEVVEGWGSAILLNEDNFQTTLDGSVKSLVMFFAPWCGHCKNAKPAFIEAASKIPKGTLLAAVDCTVAKDLCAKNEVRGYPTFYFFENGKRGEKYGGPRKMEDFVKALGPVEAVKRGEETVKPVVKEAVEDWGSVALLNEDNFQTTLDGSVKSLVMFFAPWCGHCKNAKPAFIEAASQIPKGSLLAAVDCTVAKDLCSQNEVKGFPTFYMFDNGKRNAKYGGARSVEAFKSAVSLPGPDVKTEL